MSDIYISADNPGVCRVCGRLADLRGSTCFDCASRAEELAARRSPEEHRAAADAAEQAGAIETARICRQWAHERETKTGDYAPGGVFETEYGIKL
jgi:hypothetical protein